MWDIVMICFKPNVSLIDNMLFSKGCVDAGNQPTLKSPKRMSSFIFEGEIEFVKG